jgi:hypothetical protein
MRIILLIIIITAFFSCETESDRNKIGDVKMEAIMFDLLRAEVITRDFLARDSARNLDSSNIAMQKSIFKKHNVSREDFNESFNYYLDHPNNMSLLMDSIIAKQTRSKEQKSRIKISKDSIR